MVTREFFRRWGEYRQLMRELKSYSDVELAELGMVRSACARTAFDAAFLNCLTAPIQRSQTSTSPSSSNSPRPLPRHLVRFRG